MQVTFEHTPQLASRAFRRYTWRSAGGAHLGIILVAAVGILGTISGRAPWFWGLCLGVSATYWAGYWSSARQWRAAILALPDRQVTIELNESGCRFATTLASTSVPWSAVASVWRFKELWLVLLRGGRAFMTLPAESLSSESRALIEARVTGAGGTVS